MTVEDRQSQFVPTQAPVLRHTLASALEGHSGLHSGHYPALGWGNTGQAALTAPGHSLSQLGGRDQHH